MHGLSQGYPQTALHGPPQVYFQTYLNCNGGKRRVPQWRKAIDIAAACNDKAIDIAATYKRAIDIATTP